jgi:hypothetical protein
LTDQRHTASGLSEDRGQPENPGIVTLDMAHFMGQYPGELTEAQITEKPVGDPYGGIPT